VGRAIAMIVIAIIKPVFGAKKETGNGEHNRERNNDQLYIHKIFLGLQYKTFAY
jgi:hypothetical protein